MFRGLLTAAVVVGVFALPAGAQTLRQRLIDHVQARSRQAAPFDPATVMPGTTRREVAYGADPEQSLEVYAPPAANGLPVIVMVHGGGWRIGDKNSRGVVDNKLKHWLPQGYVLISVDYRLLPQAPVDMQAEDVANAIVYVENHAAEWGGDGRRLILMGHSAGAHLVSLLSADPAQVTSKGGHAWRGTVVLDSAALDVAHVMQTKHPKLYDDAFGSDPAFWARVSPTARLKPDAVPMLLVCSLKRPDDSCGQSNAFAAKLRSIGHDTQVEPQPLTHMEVNNNLGLAGDYTDRVDAFIRQRLQQAS